MNESNAGAQANRGSKNLLCSKEPQARSCGSGGAKGDSKLILPAKNGACGSGGVSEES